MKTQSPLGYGPLLATAVAIAILAPAVARAQTAPQGQAAPTQRPEGDTILTIGETIVVTGTASPIKNILTSVDVLGADVAQRENVDYPFAMFARLPGVVTTNFNQGMVNGAFSFRGFNGEGGINAVKLLVDGIPSNTHLGYTWMLDQVFPLDIASVELVRGTSDPRYGLHNIAGNANVLTRIGGTYLDTKLMAGAYNTFDGQASGGLERGKFSQNYAVGYRRGDSYRDHADFERVSLSGKWFYTPGKFRVGGIVRFYDASGQEPGFLLISDAYTNPEISYPVSQTDGGDRNIGQYSFHADGQLTKTLSTSAKAYAVHYDEVRFVRFSALIPQQERNFNEWHYGGIATVDYRPNVGTALHAFTIEAGTDYQYQDNTAARYRTASRVRTSTVFDQKFNFSTYGGFVQAVIEPTRWLKITPAYRVDWAFGDFTDQLTQTTYPVNGYGTINQPKVSAVFTPVKGLGLYGNYGRTFQVSVGPAGYKIPPRLTDLDPSVNEGWEGGVKFQRSAWLEGRFAVWRQTASGEVHQRQFTNDFANIGSTKRDGFDIEATVSGSRYLSLWAAFAKQRGVVEVPDPSTPEQKGNLIDHVPEYVTSGGIDVKPTTRLRLSLLGNSQSKYELDTSNTHGRFGDYVVFNAEVAYRLSERFEISGQVKNLNNRDYEYVWWDGDQTLHAPADRRAFYVNVRVPLVAPKRP